MAERIEIGKVVDYHEGTGQIDVRLTVELHEGEHVLVAGPEGDVDLGALHIEGTDKVHEGESLSIDVPTLVAEGAPVYRVVDETPDPAD